MIRNRGWGYNENGVWGYWSHSGTMFGSEMIREDGSKYFQTCLPVFIPKVCMLCCNLDRGEYGDYGSLLSGPYCEANVWFPSKKGTCKKVVPINDERYWLWVESENLRMDMVVANRFASKHSPGWRGSIS